MVNYHYHNKNQVITQKNLFMRYIPDLLPYSISVASKNFVSTLTTFYGSTQIIFLASDDLNPHQVMKKDDPYHVRAKIVYCSRKCDEKYATPKTWFYCSRALINAGNFINVMNSQEIIQMLGISSLIINIVWMIVLLVDVIASFLYFTSHAELMFVLVYFLFHS